MSLDPADGSFTSLAAESLWGFSIFVSADFSAFQWALRWLFRFRWVWSGFGFLPRSWKLWILLPVFGMILAGSFMDYDLSPNHALQRTRLERRGCNRRVLRAGSLSLGR